ncbi:PTS sugar transporter subunit IIB [Bacteroides thetaiotaomicron]|nr:PTS sugar transporter subunit IIB [Bacteroides thetaiotaomicron]
MIKIVLACAFGMSTSMLVQRMQQEAVNRGLNADICALSETELKGKLANVNVLLLGPQIRFQLKSFKAEFEPMGIAVDVIEMPDYGRMNGAAVLDKALALSRAKEQEN